MRLVVVEFMTLDGVMEAPGFEEHRSGRNAWAMRVNDAELQEFTGSLIVGAYALMLPVTASSALPTRGGIPLAFAMALVGLYACVIGRDVVGQILGFLMFENGIFALGLLAAYGLPGLVEAGVFLDVLVVVLVAEGLVMQIRSEHATLDVDLLRELRG